MYTLTETEVQLVEKSGSSVGINVGLKDFSILSDSTAQHTRILSVTMSGVGVSKEADQKQNFKGK
ncbi:hypothetical protein [Bacillus cereus]|uniref:hypothetical protein n=1 Tax=Bacillus cereus TaxID=1396 RepID=UPI0009520CB4|nr:hypothetical protein [Bacillus cereus]OLR22775.1 hypothetical protein BLD50_26380 [Bacillus cereus]